MKNTICEKKSFLMIFSFILAFMVSILNVIIFVKAEGVSKEEIKMICSYTFDDGTVNDISDNKINGISKNVNFENASGKALLINNGGKSGNTLLEASSRVNFGKKINLANKNFTISMDIKTIEYGESYSTILSLSNGKSGIEIFNKNGLGINLFDANKKNVMHNAESSDVRLDTYLLNDDSWHNVTLNIDRKNSLSIIIDGKFVDKSDISSINGVFNELSLTFGADFLNKKGTQKVLIDNVNIFEGICDKNGNLDRGSHIIINSINKGEKICAQYKELASKTSLDELNQAIESGKTFDKGNLESINSLSNNIMQKIDAVIASAKTKEKINFQTLSDPHMMTSSNNSRNDLINGLNKINELYPDSKALVVPGDFTDNGYESQYEKYYSALKEVRNANKLAPNIMTFTGNHESSYNDTSIEEDNTRFLKYNNEFLGESYDKIYYDKWIDGYHFIGLGSEGTPRSSSEATITQVQIDWLINKLAEKAPNEDKLDESRPIFVFNHQPLNKTTLGSDEFGVGAQSDYLKSIFANYPQIIYTSGHVHNGIVGDKATYNDGYGTLIDLPSFRSNDYVKYSHNIGYTVSVYEGNTIIYTPIDFTLNDIQYENAILINSASFGSKSAKNDINEKVTVSSGSGKNIQDKLLDNYASSFVSLSGENKYIVFNLDEKTLVNGLRILTIENGNLLNIKILTSIDGTNFELLNTYELENARKWQKISFKQSLYKAIKIEIQGNDKVILGSMKLTN